MVSNEQVDNYLQATDYFALIRDAFVPLEHAEVYFTHLEQLETGIHGLLADVTEDNLVAVVKHLGHFIHCTRPDGYGHILDLLSYDTRIATAFVEGFELR